MSTLDTLAAIADELGDLGLAVAMLPLARYPLLRHPQGYSSLEELAERRASIAGRLGETRLKVVALRETMTKENA